MMLFQLPEKDVLYRALLDRDAAFEGRAYVGVTSTGIFCRLTCPARKPLAENCTFFETVGECMAAGFRPCRRCHPLTPAAESDPVTALLMDALQKQPGRRWSQADIVALGLDPSTVRRSFKRHFGITFLEMARQERLRMGFQTLSETGRVIEAQIDAGYDSPGAFRAAFSRMLGIAPGQLADGAILRARWLATPLGTMIAVADQHSLHLLEFADRKALPNELKRLRTFAKGRLGIGQFETHDRLGEELAAYFSGQNARFQVPLYLHGSAFTKAVWHALRQIPAGETRSYGQLAGSIGHPTAFRAVARANGANQIALIIPCHRVIGADGALTGYGGGLWRKQKLIEIEKQFIRSKSGMS
ncbi:6-O-methylguanine DNA methyltransferase [Pelagibacterium lentulum]|uniref:methylated-DNA--[protein]-cysteine S-methyltransferase n=2 Tax=Pelagibacterium lentulum TaxID=2029865 RepID=A0A916VV18_9HYPH|nr:6-O-methylguanine DNA methyltransferase [Pelagibacterium lentulum]